MSEPIHKAVSAADLSGMTCRKSRHSGQLGKCVQPAALPVGAVVIHHSRDPGGLALTFSQD